MKKLTFLLALIVAWVISGCAAMAASHGSVPKCTYALTASVDGCAGALSNPSAYSVIHPTFFSGYANQTFAGAPTRAWVTNAHPAHNVAGVDYYVGIPQSAFINPANNPLNYDLSTTGPTSGGGYLKRFTTNNFVLDGMCVSTGACATNGCSIGSGPGARVICQGTIPSTNTYCGGGPCIAFIGYDWTDSVLGGVTFYPGSGPTNTPIAAVVDSYIVPTVNTAPNALVRYNQGPLWLVNDYVWFRGATGSVWGATNTAIQVAGTNTLSTSVTSPCGDTSPYCVAYSAFLQMPPRNISVGNNSCSDNVIGCAGLSWAYNYQEGQTYPNASIVASVDGVSCLTISSYNYGSSLTNGQLLLSPTTTTMTVGAAGCNGANSYAVSGTSIPTVTNQTFYEDVGIHGDPQFFAAGTPNPTNGLPALFGPFKHIYSTFLTTTDSLGGTGLVTWNTTNGVIIKAATISNSQGGAGTTLNVTNASSLGLFPGSLQVGMYVGTGTYTGTGSTFLDATRITATAASGGTPCVNSSGTAVACTGTGGNGTYVVNISQNTSISSSSGLEAAGVAWSQMIIDSNVLITNPNMYGDGNPAAPYSTQGAVFGDNHSLANLGNFDISGNAYDPSFAYFCLDPSYNYAANYTPGTGAAGTNINLLGNGSGGPDPNANSLNCHGHY